MFFTKKMMVMSMMNPFQQTQKLLSKMTELQEVLEKKEVVGESGAGLIKITLNCKNEIRLIKIDPSLLIPSDVEILEDLLIAAFREARQKVETVIAEESGKISTGLPKIPGMPF